MLQEKRFLALILLAVLVVSSAVPAIAQSSTSAGAIGETTVDMVLSYLDTAASYMGQGLLHVVNLLAKGRVSGEIEKPLGYLCLITGLLLVFSLLEAARKVVWIAIIGGWVLLVARIVMDVIRQ